MTKDKSNCGRLLSPTQSHRLPIRWMSNCCPLPALTEHPDPVIC